MSIVTPQVRDLFGAGAVLAGRFEAREPLVADHLGQRQVAWQGREVVVRLMSVGLVPSWRDDLHAILGLEHGKLVSTLEWGALADGTPWIVSERHRGPRLDSLLADGAGLPLEEVVPLVAQVLMPVGHAHERGQVVGPLLARDVVVGERGGHALSIKLADFGLARVLATRPFDLPPAPEIVRGAAPTEASDVFELGLLLHHLLAGAPLRGSTVTGSGSALEPLRPDVPRALLVLLDAMLSDTPERRPHDANAVVERLIDAVPKSLFRLPSARGRVDDATSASSTTAGRTGTFTSLPHEPTGASPTTSPRVTIDAALVESGRGWRVPVGVATAIVAVGFASWLALASSSSDESRASVSAAATVPSSDPASVAAAPAPRVPAVEPTPAPAAIRVEETTAAARDATSAHAVVVGDGFHGDAADVGRRHPPKKSTASKHDATAAPPPAPTTPSTPTTPIRKAASSALLTDETPTKPRSSELLLDQ